MHSGKPKQCASKNCKVMVCENCRPKFKDGQRYCHILDPRTGWPVSNAPHSVTTVAPTCLQAGMLSSLAMLMGSDAETFLDEQDVRYWSLR